MKYFISFLLLVFAPSFVPNTAFAAINSTRVITHSTISPPKKLTFKEKLLRKLHKHEGNAVAKAERVLLIGLLLLVVGIVLMVVGENKSKAANANSSGYLPNFAGTGETLGGVVLAVIGGSLLFRGFYKKHKLAKAAKTAS